MASSSLERRRWEAEEPYCTDTWSFLRTLLPGTDFQTFIEIPRKFARYCFGAKPLLPVNATLRARSGVSRCVTMTRRGDDLVFSDGWKEFVKSCTFQAYNILMFKYDGHSAFDVKIIDKKYLLKEVSSIRNENSQAREEFGKKTGAPSKTDMREATSIQISESSCDSYDNFSESLSRDNNGTSNSCKVGKEAAEEMAREFLEREQITDVSFRQVLLPTQVSTCTLNFPKKWFNKHLTQKSKSLYLRCGNKIWKSPIYFSCKGTRKCRRGDWRQFVMENHLEKHDVCVISFVSRNDDVATVDVNIFRARPTMATPLTQGSDTNMRSDHSPHVEMDTSCDLDPHEGIKTSSDVILYGPKDTSVDSPPFRATEMSSSSFIYHFERLWTSFPEEKLAQSTYLEWYHFDQFHLGKTDVLRSIKEKNIFSRNFVYVPILSCGHWNLVIFCHFDKCLDFENKKPCILLLDSLHMAQTWRSEKDIREFVSGIYKNEGISDPRVSQIPFLIPKVPQQKGSECGYFSLYFIKKFMETAPDDGDMAFFASQIDGNWFTRDEFEAFCKSIDNDSPQEMPSTSRRILRRRRCNRPSTSKGGEDEVITVE